MVKKYTEIECLCQLEFGHGLGNCTIAGLGPNAGLCQESNPNIELRRQLQEGLTSSLEIPWSPFTSLWLAGAAEGG